MKEKKKKNNEKANLIDYSKYEEYISNFKPPIDQLIEELKRKLKETNCDGYILGMSGGIDCSTVAGLCAKGNIPCYLISMPYAESMKGTQENDAKLLADTFNLPLTTYNIAPIVLGIEDSLKYTNENMKFDTENGNEEMAFANISPRVRMTVLYNIAQAHNLLVLGTSNRSEIVMGYFTKWGDGAADVEPLKNFTKTEVRIIAKNIGVPQKIIDKAPSADLWNGQTDESEMGISYKDIDNYCLFPKTVDDQNIISIIEKAKMRNKHKMNVFSFN